MPGWLVLGVLAFALTIWAVLSWRRTRIRRVKVGIGLVVIGICFFLTPMFVLPLSGRWFDHLEFPNEASSAAVPMGNGYSAVGTMFLSRLQAYGPDGRFVRGWFVPSSGGRFNLLGRADGSVFACMERLRLGFTYSYTGAIIQTAVPCTFIEPTTDQPGVRVSQGLVAWLMIPFWHPLVAVVIAVIGMLLSKDANSGEENAPEQRI